MAVGNGYSSAQILAMQKDAIRRVNEMQRAAQEKLRQTQEVLGDAPGGGSAPAGNPGAGAGSSADHAPSAGRGSVPQPAPGTHMAGHSHAAQGQAHTQNRRVVRGVGEPIEVRHIDETPEEPEEPVVPVPREEPAEELAESPENPLKGILQRLNLDEETVLLLLMLLLLVNEGADSKLIMALVYILL